MDLEARNPSSGFFRKTKVQTNLYIPADCSAPFLFAFWKVSYLNLLQAKFHSIFKLVSVAEETGLSHTLSDTLDRSSCVEAHIRTLS